MLLTGAGSMDSYLQFITVLILFVLVLVITYVTTRWIAGYQKGKAAGSNMEVMETLRVTGNKYLQIVRVGNKYMVIAIGKDEIHMLTEIAEDDLIWKDSREQELNFNAILEKFKKPGGKEND